MTRAELLRRVAASAPLGVGVRVGVEGVDGSGKTVFADELAGVWAFSVFLDVPFEVTARRMAVRDGSPPDPDRPSLRRYVEAQRHYLRTCAPRQRASVVVDNALPNAPRLVG
ncbi:MAG TPA: hypothetical protein VH373_00255 [Jatrophihabitantaceae bacterium]